MVFTDGGGGGLYLHELLEGSELVLPSPDIQPKRVSGLLYQSEKASLEYTNVHTVLCILLD